MAINDALGVVVEELNRSNRVSLAAGVEVDLRKRLEAGLEKYSMEGPGGEREHPYWVSAVDVLARRLADQVRVETVEAEESGYVTRSFYVTQESFEMAWRDICPLWPFC